MENKKTIILSILVILICLGLSAKLMIESKEYSCDKCEVHFKSKGFYEGDFQMINVFITELYEDYVNGDCLISWDKTQGYIQGGLKR